MDDVAIRTASRTKKGRRWSAEANLESGIHRQSTAGSPDEQPFVEIRVKRAAAALRLPTLDGSAARTEDRQT
jgi:hypothetical protein